MRRIEIVLGELERLTRGLCLADLAQETAFTAEAIGFNLGLARNSVSKDLNQLWNDGLAIKSRGRPVYFLHRQALETLLGRQLEDLNARCGRWRMCYRMKSITRPTIRLPA